MKVWDETLDGVDRSILAHLQADGRMTMKELGARVGLTGPAVAERVRRLEERGLISGYRAEVLPERVGRPVVAFINVAVLNDRCGELEDRLRQLEEVVECYRITGADCHLVRVAVPSVAALEQTIDRLGPLGRTTTSLVLSTPIRRKLILPPDGE